MIAIKLLITALLSTQVLSVAVNYDSSPSIITGPNLEARAIPGAGVRCKATPFNKQQIRKAVNKGVQLRNQGKQVGKNKYPHRFNNREGFEFPVEGPYQEFPILQDGEIYDGTTKPGPDRVVFNEETGEEAGVITHEGAKGNDFVICPIQEPTTSALPSPTIVPTTSALPSPTMMPTTGAPPSPTTGSSSDSLVTTGGIAARARSTGVVDC